MTKISRYKSTPPRISVSKQKTSLSKRHQARATTGQSWQRQSAALGLGDTLACYKLDRIGRSLAHLSNLLDDLNGRGIKFKTVSDGLDTSGSTGRLVLHMLAAVAQFERDLIVERTRAGLAAAKKCGRKFGAPVKWTPDMAAKAKGYFEKGLHGDEVARLLKVSRRTLFRGLRAARDHDEAVAS